MKNMGIFVAIVSLALCVSFTSCKYDDSEIWEQVENLLVRVQRLEAACEQQNSNIAALQTLLNGIKDNVYITSVSEMDNQKGYFLEFSNGKKVAIYHGEDGLNGETPSLTIIKEGDNYYWSVNGETLKDEEGNGINAGSDDSAPVLKTGLQLEEEGVAGTWEKDAVYVSIDKTSWIKVVTGEATQIFTSVEVSEENQTVIITLADGSVISVPKADKILALLFGKWESIDNYNSYSEYWIFNEDMTFEHWYSYGELKKGTYKLLQDKMVVSFGNGGDHVIIIASVSETTLYMDGFEYDSYTRVTE